jgi:hypothetical protein
LVTRQQRNERGVLLFVVYIFFGIAVVVLSGWTSYTLSRERSNKWIALPYWGWGAGASVVVVALTGQVLWFMLENWANISYHPIAGMNKDAPDSKIVKRTCFSFLFLILVSTIVGYVFFYEAAKTQSNFHAIRSGALACGIPIMLIGISFNLLAVPILDNQIHTAQDDDAAVVATRTAAAAAAAPAAAAAAAPAAAAAAAPAAAAAAAPAAAAAAAPAAARDAAPSATGHRIVIGKKAGPEIEYIRGRKRGRARVLLWADEEWCRGQVGVVRALFFCREFVPMKKSPVLRSTPLGAVGLTTNRPPPGPS